MIDQPMINFTDAAALKVKSLIDEEGNLSLNLRLSVIGGGCAGFKYGFAFDEEIHDDDFVFTKCDVKLVIDHYSYQYLKEAKIDYKEDVDGEQFVVSNPNAKTHCGCGSSFNADSVSDDENKS